jgi:predicted DNA binding CopG/RHH family protein
MATKKNNPRFVPDEAMNSTDHLDLSKAVPMNFANLKPSTETISLRLPVSLLNSLKTEANKRDVPYQSLLKVMLHEKLTELQRVL